MRTFPYIVLALAFALIGLTHGALGHEFYEKWCCNGKDCKPYHGRVEVTPQGYYIPEFDTLVPFKNARGVEEYADQAGTRYDVPDDDAEYHMCVMPWEPTKIRCFYAKVGGT
jgi:hypothetical protein